MIQLEPLHILIQMGIFISVYFVLKTLIFKPILVVLAEREKRMVGDREEARMLVKRAEEEVKKYEEAIYQAKSSAKEIRARILQDARNAEKDILGKAREDASKLISRMREKMVEDIRAEKPKFEKDLQGLAHQIAETVIGRKIDDRGHRA